MTTEQRATLNVFIEYPGPQVPLARAIAAALADLDACRAALAPVAREVRLAQADDLDPPTYLSLACYLKTAEAAAVLAAAGEGKT